MTAELGLPGRSGGWPTLCPQWGQNLSVQRSSFPQRVQYGKMVNSSAVVFYRFVGTGRVAGAQTGGSSGLPVQAGCFAPHLEQKVAATSSWEPQLGQNFMPGAGMTTGPDVGWAGLVLARFE